jgi:hypothetical protein
MVIGNDGKKAFISNKDVTTDPHRLTLTPVKSTEDIALSFVVVVKLTSFPTMLMVKEPALLPVAHRESSNT